MKFKIDTTGNHYNKEAKEKLEVLGFTFTPTTERPLRRLFEDYEKCKRAVEIEINTLEELIDLSKKFGELIIDGNSIEIYDDNRE